MHYELESVLLFGAAVMAGGINAIAGGGGLLVFPALLFAGVAPLSANATSAAAVWIGALISGATYHKELSSVARRLGPVTITSFGGGAIGAFSLLRFSDKSFEAVIPYLVALGTLLFAFAPRLTQLSKPYQPSASLETLAPSTQKITLNQPLFLISQGIISIYGGFFGGGAGILMLSLLTFTNPGKLQTLQSIKIWMSLCINAAALPYFAVVGIISWPHVIVAASGTSLGGYLGVRLAKLISAVWLRRLVIAISSALTLYFFTAL